MSEITKIDKNFEIPTNIEREGLVFKNALEAPFRIHGLFHDGERFRRVPREVADITSEKVARLSKYTSGGRLRFVTDSPYIAIKASMECNYDLSIMTLSGFGGFDVYSCEDGEDRYVKTLIPPLDMKKGYESVVDFAGDAKERLITVNFPLYSQVIDLFVGLKEGSVLKSAPDYDISVPIVYYGSSITMGGCATHPGVCYEPIISRRFNADFINLGFAGAAKGESVMADYVADLDMSIFVLDYDHNAALTQYAETHEPFYKTVRAKNPDLPIIIMTRPKYEKHLIAEEYERIEIARKTYENAKARGENVYFIPGYELMSIARGDGVVDGCHPTDLGFYSMAERLSAELEKILKK